MNCENCNRKLSEFADGRIGRIESRRIREHLLACRRCSDDLDEIKKLRILLRSVDTPEPSPAFWPETMSAVRQKAANRHRRFLPLRQPSLAWGASLCALIALVFFVQREIVHPPVPIAPKTTVRADELISLHTKVQSDMP